jgi:hypothetical protein
MGTRDESYNRMADAVRRTRGDAVMEFVGRTLGEWQDVQPAIMPGELGRLHMLTYVIPFPVRAFFDPLHATNSRPWLDAQAGAMLCLRVLIEREPTIPAVEDLAAEERLDALQTCSRDATWKATFAILEHSRRWDQFFGPTGADGRAHKLETPMRSPFDYGAFFGEDLPDPTR